MERYNFKQIERKWQEYWEQNKSFAFNIQDKKQKYYIIEMFPYPSGELHMGHVRNYSIGDVLARFKQKQGYNVLHTIGADSFGLPAENAAINKKIHPMDWTQRNVDKFIKAMKKIGLGYDFSRFIITCYPEYYGKQQELFLELFKNGLVYQKESFVNWDPVDKTVLANEQVVDGKGWRSGATVEKKKLKQWFFKVTKYAEELLQDIDTLTAWPEKVKIMQKNWIGKSEGALIDFKIHRKMRLHCPKPYFDYLKNGVKSIDGRENSPEYHYLKIGDIVEFYCGDESFLAQITQLRTYKNIKEFLNKNNLPEILPNIDSIEEGEKIYRSEFENIDKYEFLAINIQTIDDKITVYSTRPDTIAGASFMAISSDHPLAIDLAKNNKEISDFIDVCQKTSVDEETLAKAEKIGYNTGLFAINPFDYNHMPIFITNFVLMDYGTGAVFGCPAHDQRDYDFAQKYNLPLIRVVTSNANSEDTLPYTDKDGFVINSDFLNGFTTESAKDSVLRKLEVNKIGKKEINYKLRDWGFSRQRYWGCPIPIVYCDKCGVVPLDKKDLPLELPKDVTFDGKGNPLENHSTWKHTVCPKCGGPATRETDTMDTFVDSSWYFMRYIDPYQDKPINTELCNMILPIDQYIGGIEHATMHLIYARFFTKALRDCGLVQISEPIKSLFNQGMVQHKAYRGLNTKEWCFPWNVITKNNKLYNSETNEELVCEGVVKMSKSKLNVVNSEDVIDNYGADAGRVFVLSDNPTNGNFEWTEEGIGACWKYINRFYTLVSGMKDKYTVDNVNYSNKIIRNTHKLIKDVTSYIEKIEFNKAIAKIREFTNFLESIHANTLEEKESYFFAIISMVKLFYPFAPHLCSELLEKLDVSYDEWPKYQEDLTIDKNVNIAIQVNGKLRGTIEVQKDITKDELEVLAKQEANVSRYLNDASIKKVIFVSNKLINFVI